MRVTLSFERSISEDVAIMVDVLRASTTITVALENFNEVIAVKDKNKAIELAKKHHSILAGERRGSKIEGFDVGNSPVEIKDFSGKSLILTTSNGTRVLDNIKANALIGSFVNAKAVANAASKLAKNHIEVVMAGVEGRFAIEDFLGAGEIISNLLDYEIDEMAFSAYMASRNDEMVSKAIMNSKSALKLQELGYSNDISFSIRKDIYNIVPVYKDGIIKRLYS